MIKSSKRLMTRGVLEKKLFFIFSIIIFVLVFLTVLIQTVWLVKDRDKRLLVELDNLVSHLEPGFDEAIWRVDVHHLALLMNSLRRHAIVSDVQLDSDLHDKNKHFDELLFLDYKKNCADELDYLLAGSTIGPGKSFPPATLRICLNQSSLDRKLAISWLKSQMLDFFTILLVALSCMWVVRKILIRPISKLTEAVDSDKEIALFEREKAFYKEEDELDVLVKSFKHKASELNKESYITREAFSTLSEGLVVTDEKLNILRHNSAFITILSINEDSIINRSLYDFVPNSILDAKSNSVGFEVSGKDIEAEYSNLMIAESVRGYVFVFSDITNLKKALLSSVVSEKNAAIGTLSGGIAHEFNNIMAIILGCTEIMLFNKNDLSDENAAMIETIKAASLDATKLTDQINSFSKRQLFEAEIIDPNQELSTIYEFVKNTIPSTVKITIETRSTSRVTADKSHLHSSLLNMVLNAKDAVNGIGNIKLCTHDKRIDERDMVVFTVTDDGQGISSDIMNRVFDPYFTTKDQGNGIGLALTKGFVEQSGGFMELDNDYSPGTKLSMYLPANSENWES